MRFVTRSRAKYIRSDSGIHSVRHGGLSVLDQESRLGKLPSRQSTAGACQVVSQSLSKKLQQRPSFKKSERQDTARTLCGLLAESADSRP